jgi:hypothetical protein
VSGGNNTPACIFKITSRKSRQQNDHLHSRGGSRLSLRWFEPNTCHHLRKRPVSWGFPASRAVALALRCPATSMGVRLFPAVHGHIADSVRDHEPGPVAHLGRIARAGEAEADGSPNRLVLHFDGPLFSVKSPSGPGKITGGSRVWPTHGPWAPRAVARTLLISGYRLGLTTPGSSPRLPGLRIACRMQRLATDQPASSWLVRASFRRPLTDMGCTCGGPFMYLAGWYR